MKTTLLLTGLLLAGTAALAHEGEKAAEKNEQERFAAMKATMLKDLDARIALMQKFRDCASAAADHAAFKRCRDDQRAAEKALEASKRQERLREIEQRQKDLEKEKQELQKKDGGDKD